MGWLVRAGGLRTALSSLAQTLDGVVARTATSVHRLSTVENDQSAIAGQLAEVARSQATITQYQSELRTRLDGDARAERDRLAIWRSVGDLRGCERRVCSQNGEDGIIEEILRRIGVGSKYFVEFGVQSGLECCCARLAIEAGWSGLFMECDAADFARLCDNYHRYPAIQCAGVAVTSSNIEDLLASHHVPLDLDVLCIDVDGNDYWIWQAVRHWRPRIVVIEYNGSYPPPRRWVMEENLDHRWDGTNYYGASLASLTALGHKKGYTLVATDSRGVNAFFVLNELATPDRFLDPALHYHFTPPSYGTHQGSHPPRSGPHLEI
jgi:hypothetical protein